MKLIAYIPVLWPLFFAVACILFYPSRPTEMLPESAAASRQFPEETNTADIQPTTLSGCMLQVNSKGEIEIRQGRSGAEVLWTWDGHHLTIDLHALPQQDSLRITLNQAVQPPISDATQLLRNTSASHLIAKKHHVPD